jgi:hypothetical protein
MLASIGVRLAFLSSVDGYLFRESGVFHEPGRAWHIVILIHGGLECPE